MTGDRPWRVRVTATAENDIRNILQWTHERFGKTQAQIYGETLTRAIQALTEGPYVIGSRQRDEIGKGLFTLHVARGRRKGRHLVVYRIGDKGTSRMIEVLRLLHDSMDLIRHVPAKELDSDAIHDCID